ncbi:MAG: 50S ribosomal protein L15 [Dehalococcoidales bacterium]|nr:MAG: 50S ribosomal protein L15 [Dehalococcoidales bacterium]
MRLDTLRPVPGTRKNRKRVGRGNGSGRGTYSGRGVKGQKSRSGYRIRPGFEGGQLPIIKRLPRQRGFTNIFRTEYSVVGVGSLSRFESDSEVTPAELLAVGLVKSMENPVKILAQGEIEHPLTVKAHKFSAAAKAKIEAAGGSAEEVVFASKAD